MNVLYNPDSETNLGMMVDMSNEEIKRRYNRLLNEDNLQVYDGCNKGVDVYTCETCGKKVYTRYKNKGVTPFCISCPKCHGIMSHNDTISERMAAYMGVKVENWVRPPLEWLLKHKQDLRHVLNGGLVRESEL